MEALGGWNIQMLPELNNFNFGYYDIIKMISIQLKPYYFYFNSFSRQVLCAVIVVLLGRATGRSNPSQPGDAREPQGTLQRCGLLLRCAVNSLGVFSAVLLQLPLSTLPVC